MKTHETYKNTINKWNSKIWWHMKCRERMWDHKKFWCIRCQLWADGNGRKNTHTLRKTESKGSDVWLGNNFSGDEIIARFCWQLFGAMVGPNERKACQWGLCHRLCGLYKVLIVFSIFFGPKMLTVCQWMLCWYIVWNVISMKISVCFSDSLFFGDRH